MARAKSAPLGIQVTRATDHKFIEAGEQAPIAMIPSILDGVLDGEGAKEGMQSYVERRAAAFQGR